MTSTCGTCNAEHNWGKESADPKWGSLKGLVRFLSLVIDSSAPQIDLQWTKGKESRIPAVLMPYSVEVTNAPRDVLRRFTEETLERTRTITVILLLFFALHCAQRHSRSTSIPNTLICIHFMHQHSNHISTLLVVIIVALF